MMYLTPIKIPWDPGSPLAIMQTAAFYQVIPALLCFLRGCAYVKQALNQEFSLGGGGGLHTSRTAAPGPNNVGTRGHTGAEDTRLLGGPGACSPGNILKLRSHWVDLFVSWGCTYGPRLIKGGIIFYEHGGWGGGGEAAYFQFGFRNFF